MPASARTTRLCLDAFATPEPAPRCERCGGTVSWTVDVEDRFDPHGLGCCSRCGTLLHAFLTPEEALRLALDHVTELPGTGGLRA